MRREYNDSTIVSYKTVLETQAKKPLPAAARLRRGKTLIAIGTAIAMLGIALYCTTIFVGDINHDPAQSPEGGLLIIGAGLGIWIAGAIKYLNAAIDIGYADDSL